MESAAEYHTAIRERVRMEYDMVPLTYCTGAAARIYTCYRVCLASIWLAPVVGLLLVYTGTRSMTHSNPDNSNSKDANRIYHHAPMLLSCNTRKLTRLGRIQH